jgi:hypothetical protein
MNRSKKYINGPIALCLCGLLAAETSKPHAEFVAVSPTIQITAVALSNTAAATFVSPSGNFESFTPVEIKIPHDRLVLQTTGLLLPIAK